MNAEIIDRGRGPEIAGTRITVYDVMDYWSKGWRYEQIAGLFRLPPDQIQVAIRYIEDNRQEVAAEYNRIIARHRNYQYPPDVEEKLQQAHEKLKERLARCTVQRAAE